MKTETKHLNHGDICNEIETRLGLLDCKTFEKLKTYNTTFEVTFKETKDKLAVTINKQGD